MRRRFALVLAGVGLALGLLGPLVAVLWGHDGDPVLGAVSTGSSLAPAGMAGAAPAVDSRSGHAFVVDDDAIDQRVTLTSAAGAGYSYWGAVATNNVLRVIDTGAGRQVATFTMPQSIGGAFVVDPYTDRLFIVDADQGQLWPVDARHGTVLDNIPYEGGAGITAALADEPSGHLFVATDTNWTMRTADQQVLMLDGRSGATLRTLTFPQGPRVATKLPNGAVFTSYPPSLSLAADPRSDRVYVFDAKRRMVVLDGASGRVLYTRPLHVAVGGATGDGRSGRVFAFIPTPRLPVYAFIGRPAPRPALGTVVALDARSGAVLHIMPGGSATGDANGIALDEGTNRVFVVNPVSDTVGVLDGSTGALVRSVAVGASPERIVLDAGRRRAMVVVDGGRGIAVLDTRDGTLLRTLHLEQPIRALSIDTGTGHLVAATRSIRANPADNWAWLPSVLRRSYPGSHPRRPRWPRRSAS